MCLEDTCALFARVLFSFLIENALLFDSLFDCGVETRDFRFDIFNLVHVDVIDGSFVDLDLADGDSVKDALAGCNYHNFTLLVKKEWLSGYFPNSHACQFIRIRSSLSGISRLLLRKLLRRHPQPER